MIQSEYMQALRFNLFVEFISYSLHNLQYHDTLFMLFYIPTRKGKFWIHDCFTKKNIYYYALFRFCVRYNIQLLFSILLL